MNNQRPFDRALLLAAPLALSLAQGDAVAAPQYILTDLGTLSGTYSQGFNVNDAGQVAGFAYTQSNAAVRAALGLNGTGLQDLGTLGGSRSSSIDINATGQQTGTSELAGNLVSHAFRATAAGLADLGTLGGSNSRGLGINDNGDVTGASQVRGDGAEHGFLFRNGVMTDLGTLGGSNSQGNDVNNTGQVAGFADLAGNRSYHAFRWSNGARQDLGTLGGNYSEGFRINGAGTVTGYATVAGDMQHHAALWVSGQPVRDLGTLGGGFSAGYGINAAGNVVGYATNSADALRRAFVWKGASMQDLNTLILPGIGWTLTEAHGISDSGNITGVGTLTVTDLATNSVKVEPHAFLLMPDRVAPSITCPPDITTTGTQPAAIGQAVVKDNLDPAPVLSNNRPATFPNGATSVTWTVVDANGNKATCPQKVTINPKDTTPPVVAAKWTPAVPDGLNNWYKTKPAMLAWSVTDAESAVTLKNGCLDSAVSADTAGQNFTCSATSGGGVSPMATTTIKLDGTAPVITPPAAAPTGSLSGSVTTPVTFTATASDALSGVSTAGVVCAPASGTPFSLGTTPVTCTASDNAGNQGTARFNVTVSDPSAPKIAPVITGTLGNNGWFRGAVTLSWTVDEAESPATLVKTGCTGLNVATDTAGVSDSCAASSAGGNTAAVSRTLRVDSTAPALGALPVLPDQAAADASGAAVTYTLPLATDAGAGVAAVNCSPTSGATFPLGTSTVQCAATDNAGNISPSGSFSVIVKDQTPPRITCPANVSVTQGQTVVLGTASALDNVTANPQLGHNAPASFPLGTTPVVWTATDGAGLSSTCTQQVNVSAVVVPPVTPPAATVDLRVTGSVSNAAPRKGDTVSYAYVVTNIGTAAAQGVSFTDILPSTLRFNSVTTTPAMTCTRPGNNGGGTLSCTLNSVPAGASATVTVSVKVNATGTIANTGSATTSSVDTVPGNNAATVSLTAR